MYPFSLLPFVSGDEKPHRYDDDINVNTDAGGTFYFLALSTLPPPAVPASLFVPAVAAAPLAILAAVAAFLPATAFATRPTTPLLFAVVVALPPPAPVRPLLLTIVVPALFVEEAVLAALGTRGYDIVALDAVVAAVARTFARVAVVAVEFPVVVTLAPRLERADEAVVIVPVV